MSTLTTSIQHCSRGPSQCNEARRRTKRHIDRNEKSKLSLFTYNIIVYVGNPKEPTEKLLELISEFSGFKIQGNIPKKSIKLLYTIKEQLKVKNLKLPL